jgi:hypothetical protein
MNREPITREPLFYVLLAVLLAFGWLSIELLQLRADLTWLERSGILDHMRRFGVIE